ncbi:MAG: transposase [Methanobrevibacter sp.]|jgi:putative transposase|nr:transposase [Candidatus Methanovirga australis]
MYKSSSSRLIKNEYPEIKDKLVLSTGYKTGKNFSNRKDVNSSILKKLDDKINRLNQILSIRSKNNTVSRNYAKTKLKLLCCYKKKQDIFLDRIHKTTYNIVKEFDNIYVGDVNSKLGLSNHKLAKTTADQHWFEIKRQLEYKSELYGKNFEVVNESYTSKICSKCGYENDEMNLNVRSWICPDCGSNHNRDVNATINIRTVGSTGIAFDKTNIS